MSSIGMIILAAGNSSRLGQPKQLLPFRGKTLLTHVVAEALAAAIPSPVVIIGAYRDEIAAALKDQSARIVYNPHWETGMASGIVAGLSEIMALYPEAQGVIIAVCDQPFISTELLQKLIGTFEKSGKGIVASTYAGSTGTPVLFGRTYFHRLLALSGSDGAKKMLKHYSNDLAIVDFPKGDIDIDTAGDIQKLA